MYKLIFSAVFQCSWRCKACIKASLQEERHGLLTDLEQAEMFFLFNPFCSEAPLLYDNFWSIPVTLNNHVIWSYVHYTSLYLHLGGV